MGAFMAGQAPSTCTSAPSEAVCVCDGIKDGAEVIGSVCRGCSCSGAGGGVGDDEALIDSLLALEWQRGIPASFCPSSLSPCNRLLSGILPAFLHTLVPLSFSSPLAVCNIHAELISSRRQLPDPPRSSFQVITVVHPAFGFQSGRASPPFRLRRRSDVTACKRWCDH